MVTESKRYTQQVISSKVGNVPTPLKNWTRITMHEMKGLLACILNVCIIKKPTIASYWSILCSKANNLLKFTSSKINWCGAPCLDMQPVLYCRSQSAETFQDSSAQLPIWTSSSGRVYSPRSYHNIVKTSATEKDNTKWRKTRKGNYRNPAHVYFYPIKLTL
jgi:hypothetical protein